MAPKKKNAPDNAESSRRRIVRYTGPPPHTPEFYGLSVRTETARDLFIRLSKRGVEATRFADRGTLEELGVWGDITVFFNSISWGHVLELNCPTYEGLMLEILSTLVVYPNGYEGRGPRILFQLEGTRRQLSLDEVNDIYQCALGGVTDFTAELYDRNAFWNAMIVKEDLFSSGYSKASQLRNPVFRIIQRIIGHSVLARHESSNIRAEELNLLWSMLTDTHVNLAHFLLQQCMSVTSATKGIIRIGGMLTPIINHFLGDRAENYAVAKGERYINMEHLVRLTIIKSREPPYLLKQRDGTLFPLPNVALTEVTDFHDRANWKMNSPAHLQAVVTAVRRRRRPSPPSEDEEEEHEEDHEEDHDEEEHEHEHEEEEPERRRRRDNTDEDHYAAIREHMSGVDAQILSMRGDIAELRSSHQEHVAYNRAAWERQEAWQTAEVERRYAYEMQMIARQQAAQRQQNEMRDMLARFESYQLRQGHWQPPPPPPPEE